MSYSTDPVVNYIDNVVKDNSSYLDFKNDDMNYSTHKYHHYPAILAPKLPELFLNAVLSSRKINLLYDPFVGSGTVLVEGVRHEVDSIGIDINPLAVLISKVKTKKLVPERLHGISNYLFIKIASTKSENVKVPNFTNIDYWFKPSVIHDLQVIKNAILEIEESDYKNFFLLAFSETVRDVSNTRNSEFKLYRMPAKKLEKWNPDVYGKFREIVARNIALNDKLHNRSAKAELMLGKADNSTLPNNSVDLIITSPPYGDSKTTVAYGQFSRLSLQWLDLAEYSYKSNLDSTMLGGKKEKITLPVNISPTLSSKVATINAKDPKRANEVIQFYNDLYKVLQENVRVLRPNSYQFWVTANRTVKGVVLPTDRIIEELYSSLGVYKIKEYTRAIPNKRMPSKNSPTNQKGNTESTMRYEQIVIYKN